MTAHPARATACRPQARSAEDGAPLPGQRADTATPRRTRLPNLDKLRGLAVLLMVLDHALLVAGDSPWVLRHVITRPSLPLFLLVAGSLWRPGWRTRHLDLLSAAAVGAALDAVLGMPQPGILLVVVLVLPLVQLFRRAPLTGAVVGLLQTLSAPLPWTGYQPGWVLAFLLLGVVLGDQLQTETRWASRLPRVVGLVGRYPLSFYLGHLAALAVITQRIA